MGNSIYWIQDFLGTAEGELRMNSNQRLAININRK